MVTIEISPSKILILFNRAERGFTVTKQDENFIKPTHLYSGKRWSKHTQNGYVSKRNKHDLTWSVSIMKIHHLYIRVCDFPASHIWWGLCFFSGKPKSVQVLPSKSILPSWCLRMNQWIGWFLWEKSGRIRTPCFSAPNIGIWRVNYSIWEWRVSSTKHVVKSPLHIQDKESTLQD